MDTNRRDFLMGALWMGAAAATVGCTSGKARTACCAGAPGCMSGYADKPFKALRVGVVGLGRGSLGIDLGKFPNVKITAICDITQSRIDRALARCAKNKIPAPRIFTGSPEAWKQMCEWDQVDLVYNGTPWQLHVPIALYAMEHGKHVVVEVPSALTLDDCWALVETSERTRRHCMQLENCCYGETEMLALNMCRQGLFGTLVHGEGAYIHDLRKSCYGKFDPATGSGGYWDYWRLRYNRAHGGNQYPTHGLGPICIDMDINRGDNFDYLVSVDSLQAGFQEYGKGKFGAGSPEAGWKVKMGDMNTTIIKTKLGRTIMVQHNVTGPRPYSRINLISGTKGMLQDYPLRIALEKVLGEGAHAFNEKETAELREKYKHPLWKTAGEYAKIHGGHGGMDFLMLLRLAWCLQMGQPLDMNVYDLAAWCSLNELTEKSADSRGRSMDVPDFTRGAWKTQKPWGFEDVDLAKMGLNLQKG